MKANTTQLKVNSPTQSPSVIQLPDPFPISLQVAVFEFVPGSPVFHA